MASLTDIIRKQRAGGSSRTGALFSSVGMKVLESIDPRRMLNQTGLLTALFPSLKAYKAGGTESRVAKASSDFSSLSTPILQEMVVKLDTISAISKITARNTQALPSMARDMNVMRQNVIKLVKLQGGNASTRADAFFTRAFERERATEAQLMAAKDQRQTGVTKVVDTPKSDSGGSMFGGLLAALAAGGLVKALTSIPNLILNALTKIPSLIVDGLAIIPRLIMNSLSGLTSILSKGLKITFGALSGLANSAMGLTSTIIRAAAALLLSGPGLAVLGVGGAAALLGYLLTSEKTKNGDSETGSMLDDQGITDPTQPQSNQDVTPPKSLSPQTDPGESPATTTPTKLKSSQGDMQDLIYNRFREAGFSHEQAIGAVANAKAESNLNPNAHNEKNEDSVGLFQINRRGILGKNYSVEQLKDPETNIKIAIEAAKKSPMFTKATTIAEATEGFMRQVENPNDQSQSAIQKRTNIALAMAEPNLGNRIDHGSKELASAQTFGNRGGDTINNNNNNVNIANAGQQTDMTAAYDKLSPVNVTFYEKIFSQFAL